MLYIILEKQASGVEVERGESNHKGEAFRGPAARSAPPPPPPNPYEPAYMRIVRTVSSRIAHGDYREGDQLPSESQFCTEFDVSPMTLRRAVNMLVDRGLVSTVQGRGTFVRSLDLSEATFKLQHIADRWQDAAADVRLLDATIEPANGAVAQMLEIGAGEKTVFLRRLFLKEALGAGEVALAITRAAERGMRLVGQHYEDGTYFLSGLIMAGEIFKNILALVMPSLEEELVGEESGRVLVGTVSGDIHDIGKNILTTALRGFGFTVEDLGVDVPPEVFLEKVDSFQPDVVGLSGLTSASYKSMRRTVEVLRGSPQQPDGLPIVIGGATVDEEGAAVTHADSWTKDAMEGIRIIQQFVDERRHARPLPASPLD